ncbi:MAG: SDR family oxidoreductase [Pseudomonadota bacterium]
MTKVLVAGATGYLGNFIVEELARRSIATKAIARTPERLRTAGADQLEVVKAEVTQRETLRGLLEDVDTVISSVGITRQRDGLSYDQVDYQANLNLLREALAGNVQKFIYVSVFNGKAMRDLEICKAKERFVDELKSSGLAFVVIRPNGFFSDMASFVEMARKGRVYIFGDGHFRSNPIHGADLAKVCVDAIELGAEEIEVGGPDTLSQKQIAALAFEAVGNNDVSITKIPDILRRAALVVAKWLTPRTVYGPLQFFLTVLARDMLAPETGERRLADFFEQEAKRGRDEAAGSLRS